MAVYFRAGVWSSPPTIVGTRFIERWRGLRPRSLGRALLIRGSSVHGIGMKESLWVVGLDETGVVLEVRLLRPGRFVKIPEATWVLELTAAAMPPSLGSVLRRAAGDNGQRVALLHARHSGLVRHSNRQPV